MKQARLQGMWRIATGLMVSALILAGCATPTPVTIIQTQEVPVTSVVVETSVVRETQVVEVEVPVEVTAVPEMGDGPVLNQDVSGNVELWHFWASPVRRNAIRRVIAYCQTQLPNITVVDTVKPFGDLWTANVAAVAAGSGMPDVIISDRPTLPRDAADGVYMNLQEWADRDNVTRDQFYDWAWDQTLYEGATYGLPHETDVRVLFYNKTLFEAAGLDPNDPPENWAELEAAADALDVQNPDGTYARIGFFPLWNAGPDFYQYVVEGADMIAPDGTVQINNPEMVETVEWIKSWVERYGGWDAVQAFNASANAAAPNDNFMSSKVAMRLDIFGYNSFLEFYRPFTDVDLDGDTTPNIRTDWGVALIPGKDGPGGTWSGGFSMSIPNGAPNAEAAWEFMKCATGAEAQSSWARDTQAQPTNVTAAEDPVLAGNPLWGIVDEALAVSTGGVFVEDYPNWTEQLAQRWELVWTDELTAQEALDEAQQAVADQVGQ